MEYCAVSVVPVTLLPPAGSPHSEGPGARLWGEQSRPGPRAPRGPAALLTERRPDCCALPRPVGPADRCGLWPCSRRRADSEADSEAFIPATGVVTVTRGAGARPRGALLLSRPPICAQLAPLGRSGSLCLRAGWHGPDRRRAAFVF